MHVRKSDASVHLTAKILAGEDQEDVLLHTTADADIPTLDPAPSAPHRESRPAHAHLQSSPTWATEGASGRPQRASHSTSLQQVQQQQQQGLTQQALSHAWVPQPLSTQRSLPVSGLSASRSGSLLHNGSGEFRLGSGGVNPIRACALAQPTPFSQRPPMLPSGLPSACSMPAHDPAGCFALGSNVKVEGCLSELLAL